MANYKESTVTGSSYIRSYQVSIANPLDGKGTKAINFLEEKVINLDGEQILKPLGGIQEPFNEQTINNVIDVLNPETGESTGMTVTYGQLYAILYSMYYMLANRRDSEEGITP